MERADVSCICPFVGLGGERLGRRNKRLKTSGDQGLPYDGQQRDDRSAGG